MNTCKICNHAQRAEIDAALVAQGSNRSIAFQYGISHTAVARHKKHIPAALTQAKQAEEVAEATTLLARVERMMARCETIVDKASSQSEWQGAVAALNQLRLSLELIGKLSGELRQPGVNIGIGVAIDARSKGNGRCAACDRYLYELLDEIIADDDDDPPAASTKGNTIEGRVAA